MSRISVLAGAVALFLFGASAFLLAGGREGKLSTKPEVISASSVEPIVQAKPLARIEPEPVAQTHSVSPTNPTTPTSPTNPAKESLAPGSAREAFRSTLPVPSIQRPLPLLPPAPPVEWEDEEDLPDPEAEAAAVEAADLVHELMKKRH